METKRKHIPLWIFKSAERLDKQCSAIEKALQDINVINAKKKREDAINIIREWLPEVEQFTSQVKFVDGYVRTLVRENVELTSAVRKEKQRTSEVEDILEKERTEVGKKERQHYYQMRELQSQLNKNKKLLDKVPKEVREEVEKQMRRERTWGAR